MPGPHDTKEFAVLAKENADDVVIRKARWASMKAEFIDASITGKPIHWPTLSAKYGFQSQTARNRASMYKWYAEIDEQRKKREEVLEAKMVERSTLAIEQLNKDFATNEAAIRSRHATIARGLQAKAVAALNGKDLGTFSPTELLKMLELGIREERFAMGMSEVAPEAANAGQEGTSTVFKPISEQVGGHKRMQEVGALLLKELQKMGKLDDITDVEARNTGPEEKVFTEEQQPEVVQSVAPGGVGISGDDTPVAPPALPAPAKPVPKIVIKHVSKEAA
jgi:hypothetical protein